MSHAAYLDMVTKAHQAGKEARAAGEPIEACPHPGDDINNPERRSWRNGWRACPNCGKYRLGFLESCPDHQPLDPPTPTPTDQTKERDQ